MERRRPACITVARAFSPHGAVHEEGAVSTAPSPTARCYDTPMPEPQIRYARTVDGVSIAYYTMGEGPALVLPSNILWSNVRTKSALLPEYARAGAGIGRNMTVVRYDARGAGMSDRSSLDHGIEARLTDLDAVVAKLSLERFSLLGAYHSAATAIEYAARHPEKVERLVLCNPYAVGTVYQHAIRRFESFRELAREEWEEYTIAIAAANVGYSDPVLLQSLAKRFRESMEPEAVQSFHASLADIDVRPSLARVQAPTLVFFREGAIATGSAWSSMTREVASGIPDCEFIHSVAERGALWTAVDTAAVERFFGIAPAESNEPAVASELAAVSQGPSSGTAIILFADIVDSTALTERLGDTAFREKARALDDALRIAVRDHGGAAIDGKLLGDGILATFPAASQAITAALSFESAAAASQLQLHVGLHAGDVIREQDAGGQTNVYGGAVNIAARISALAAPGEVLVSDTVRSLARTSAGVTFEDRGEHALKGIAEPQRVFAVRPSAL